MKRDMDLVRRILLEVEEKGGDPLGWLDLSIPGYSPEVVSHHVWLLKQARFLTAQNLSNLEAFDVRPKALTWEGHEFLDAARNDTVWNAAKNQVKGKLGTVPLEIFKALLLKLAMTTLGM
jgi:hypothetical protein